MQSRRFRECRTRPFWSLALLAALWLLALVPPSAMAQSARRVALLIGNQDYVHERKLRNPVNDAVLLGQVLKDDLKFDTVRVERNLGVDGMDRVIDEFANQARGADTVVFYYSGHGLTSSADSRTYLVPVDARIGVPGAPRLDRQAVAGVAVRDRLRALGARITLLILDACRDGPGDGKSGNKGLTRMGGANQLLVAYATEEGKVAADGAGANSPYAEALARAWRQQELSVLQQLDFVYDEVTRRVPDQQPTREGNLRADSRLANPFTPVRPQDLTRLEDEAWAQCRNGATASPCQDYLESWKQGRYVALAGTRIRDLQELSRLPRQSLPSASASQLVGSVFRDCTDCPQMVVLPQGRFAMGSPAGEAGRTDDEGPVHEVTMGYRLAVGKFEVSRGEFERFVQTNGYRTEAEQGDGCFAWDGKEWKKSANRNWRNPGFEQGDSHPVVCVSWNDAQAYVKWLREKTGKGYRLLSEAEWEYAARAGQGGSRYPWGDDAANSQQCAYANGADETAKAQALLASGWVVANCSDGYAYTAPGDALKANPFGLHQMQGNAWEWVQDVWHDNYSSAPADGSAWLDGGDRTRRVLRGGSWISKSPVVLRSANRFRFTPTNRDVSTGFRIARTF